MREISRDFHTSSFTPDIHTTYNPYNCAQCTKQATTTLCFARAISHLCDVILCDIIGFYEALLPATLDVVELGGSDCFIHEDFDVIVA